MTAFSNKITKWSYRHRLFFMFLCLLAFIGGSIQYSKAQTSTLELPDSMITGAVERRLMESPLVSSHLLDVSTSQGVVKLSGQVENILAAEQAINLAKATVGVKMVIDGMEVMPLKRPDNEIKDDIEDAMALDPAADSYEVRTKVKDGKVTLEGKVESWAEKTLSGRLAKGVKGVKSVENDIMVRNEDIRPDGEVKSDIKRRLEIDAAINEDPIKVEVNKGKVTLTGTVSSAAAATRAANNAWVNGVRSVQTDFEINWRIGDTWNKIVSRPLTDQQVRQAVVDALIFDPRVNSVKTKVRVVNGTVTLMGTVDNLAAKRAAEKRASDTVGVFRVINLLRVRPDERPTDSEIAKRVKNALERDPFLDKYDVDVSAINGQAILNGLVNRKIDKRRAEMIASDVAGVIAVQNNISVLEKWTFKDDLEILDNVRNQLWWSPFVDSDQVSVDVEYGEVTLTGKVDSWFERRRAAENAIQGGAKIVWNKLKVKEAESDQFELY